MEKLLTAMMASVVSLSKHKHQHQHNVTHFFIFLRKNSSNALFSCTSSAEA
jgi:hypothetical protein